MARAAAAGRQRGNNELSALDRIRQLDEERRRVMEEAKAEAMTNVREAVSALNAIGFNYQITQGGRAAAPRRGTRQVNRERACPICGFITNPPHDARAHRGQGNEKRPFSAEELQAKGMT